MAVGFLALDVYAWRERQKLLANPALCGRLSLTSQVSPAKTFTVIMSVEFATFLLAAAAAIYPAALS